VPTPPAVTVVAATYRRAGLLPRLVEAVANQQVPGGLELILVDDASPDDTPAVLAALSERHPCLTVLRQERNAGPATARNRGWRAATGDVILFTDDDCVPQPGWAAALAARLADADLAQGRTLPDPAQELNTGPFSRTLEVTSESGFYQTCNMAYRRDLLEQLGGFDEEFPDAAGEDTDLAWRALAGGARSVFEPDAVVHHDIRPSSFRAHVADLRRWRSVVLATRRHPGLRSYYHRPWLWRASHSRVLIGLAGLLVAGLPVLPRRWRLSALLLLLPYVNLRMRVQPLAGPRRRSFPAIPAAFVADAIEVSVVARASIRQRTFLL
jgi:GT2 family glycosyltransferase